MIAKTETERLILRTASVADISDNYIEALNSYEIVKYTEARHTVWDRESVEKFVKNQKHRESELIGIFIKNNLKHIGNIRLSSFSDIHKRLELGILLFDQSEWSKGYGCESLLGIEKYIFHDLGYKKIIADYYAANKASERLFHKAGYSKQGVFESHFFHEEGWIDSVRVAKFAKR